MIYKQKMFKILYGGTPIGADIRSDSLFIQPKEEPEQKKTEDVKPMSLMMRIDYTLNELQKSISKIEEDNHENKNIITESKHNFSADMEKFYSFIQMKIKDIEDLHKHNSDVVLESDKILNGFREIRNVDTVKLSDRLDQLSTHLFNNRVAIDSLHSLCNQTKIDQQGFKDLFNKSLREFQKPPPVSLSPKEFEMGIKKLQEEQRSGNKVALDVISKEIKELRAYLMSTTDIENLKLAKLSDITELVERTKNGFQKMILDRLEYILTVSVQEKIEEVQMHMKKLYNHYLATEENNILLQKQNGEILKGIASDISSNGEVLENLTANINGKFLKWNEFMDNSHVEKVIHDSLHEFMKPMALEHQHKISRLIDTIKNFEEGLNKHLSNIQVSDTLMSEKIERRLRDFETLHQRHLESFSSLIQKLEIRQNDFSSSQERRISDFLTGKIREQPINAPETVFMEWLQEMYHKFTNKNECRDMECQTDEKQIQHVTPIASSNINPNNPLKIENPKNNMFRKKA